MLSTEISGIKIEDFYFQNPVNMFQPKTVQLMKILENEIAKVPRQVKL